MKSVFLTLLASSMSLVSLQAVSKADVEINWQNPENYRDVTPTAQTRKSFREQVFSQLGEYMEKLAETLPDQQKLQITVTNLDLAGQVWPASFVGLGNSASDVRIIKNIDIPRISFSYSLQTNGNEVLKQGEVELKDMAFMDRPSRFFDSDNLRYEKTMLKDWFEETFPVEVAKN